MRNRDGFPSPVAPFFVETQHSRAGYFLAILELMLSYERGRNEYVAFRESHAVGYAHLLTERHFDMFARLFAGCPSLMDTVRRAVF